MKSRIARWSWFAAAALTWSAADFASAQEGNDATAAAKQILAATGLQGGFVVHVDCGDGRLTAALRAGPGFLVHGLAVSEADVDQARAHIKALRLYGPVSVDGWNGRRLPYKDNLVNLLISATEQGFDEAEVERVLAPGGVALIAGAREQGPGARGEKVQIGGESWRKTVKPRPGEIDEWTHYLHDATGNPVAHDAVVGPPRRLQWVGSPRWARHHDHMASMTGLVSSGGRLFYIFDEGPTASIQLPAKWQLVARDAFNGTILWKREIASWNTHQWPLKSGPAHLTRRLVAVGDRVYATLSLEAPVTALDAATGQTVLTYEGSDHAREILVSDGVLLALLGWEPSPLPDWRRRDSYVWDNSRRANADWAWEGAPRRIAAYDAASGRLLWQKEAPVAPCSLAADAARIIYYDGQKVVCLAHADGNTLWESEPIEANLPVHTSTGPRTLIYDDVVLFAGNTGTMTALSAEDGRKLWSGKQYRSGHQSLRDLLVAGGLVWSGFIAGGGDSGIFTGRDPHETGVQTNRAGPLDAGVFPCMGTIFKQAGYDTGYVGKWHLPFPRKDNASYGFDSMENIKGNGADRASPAAAIEFLRKSRKGPFLLVVSFVNPHNICQWARGEPLPDGPIGEPPPLDACPPLRPNHLEPQHETDIVSLMRRSYQSSRTFPVSAFGEEKWRQYAWAYYRMIEMVDGHIAEVLAALRDSGQGQDTLVVFTSDHGDCQGAHRWNQKTVFYDESSRVPLILCPPGVTKAATSDRLVHVGVDLLPTLCDYAGTPVLEGLPGLSLKTTARGEPAQDPRECLVISNKMIQGEAIDGEKPEPEGRMVRSHRYKYCVYSLGKRRESLVDMQNDPGETVNLAENEQYEEILRQHRRYLAQWCRKNQDGFLRFVPQED